MDKTLVIPLDSPQADLETVGGKGASLAKLLEAGLPVPGGFHLTTEAYRCFVAANGLQSRIDQALAGVDINQPQTLEAASTEIQDLFHQSPIPEEIAAAIRQAYLDLDGSHQPVAVRSSATAEDLPEASFAGQQESYLNISGVEAVLEATRKCWGSLWTGRAIGYRARQGIPSGRVALAVVVQTLVPAEVSGILFTANPLNGARDQVVINATWGLGEAIVGGAVTPDSLTVEKATGAVIERTTSSKSIQTVMTEAGTQPAPVPAGIQNEATLNEAQAARLASLGVQIEALYGTPMDIEWALVDGAFSILQARPITALPAPPLEWTLPHPKGVYMRGSVVDLMPDPLSPLFVSLGIPTLRKQMQPLGKLLTGSDPVLADDYFTTINSYAYMNATMPPKAWWWVLTGLLPSYPKFFTKLVPLWRDELHPEYQAYVASKKDEDLSGMTAGELWQGAQDMLDAIMYYVCALMFATMGASAGSEMLLTKVYDKFARREGDPPAPVLLMGWDNIPIRSEKSLYDLADWCRQRPTLSDHILGTPTDHLARQLEGLESQGTPIDGWEGFCARFQEHMDQFGHGIYQLDVAEDLPLDHPEPMLEIIKMYLRGEGADPHKRQRASEALRIRTATEVDAHLKGLKRWAYRKALKWGQSLAEVREDALADIGLGYPKLRAILLALGQHLVEAGLILDKEAIFWLEADDIDGTIRSINDGERLNPLTGQVNVRKATWKQAKETTPPPMIPVKERVMGFKADLFVAHTQDDEGGNTLKGVAASAGVVTAPACVLHGPEDFDQMHPGDVLVAGTTTPAWTPLFVMASAVVTDIGGPLSHGSIVAREYGIPAVMGTGVATRRIRSGQTITVDGGKGTVEILS